MKEEYHDYCKKDSLGKQIFKELGKSGKLSEFIGDIVQVLFDSNLSKKK